MYWHLKIIYRDISKGESEEVLKSMGADDEDQGAVPDASPSIRYIE